MIVLILMTALLGQPASSSVALDFEFYKSEVQPIFLEKRAGFTRCVVCHTGDGNSAFLEPLSDGAMTWDEEQTRSNFARVFSSRDTGRPVDKPSTHASARTGGRRRRVPQRRTAVYVSGRHAIPDARRMGAWSDERQSVSVRNVDKEL